MKGGTIIVEGDAGFMTGLYMMGGSIIVLGGLGRGAGESIIGGRIFFAGEAKSLGKNTKVSGVEDGEVNELGELFSRYHVKANAGSFNKITPVKRRPFYGD
jgi:glutamate synthase domain-containing protein 3